MFVMKYVSLIPINLGKYKSNKKLAPIKTKQVSRITLKLVYDFYFNFIIKLVSLFLDEILIII